MNHVTILSQGQPADFTQTKAIADAVAENMLGESVCLSWYDRAEDRESPAHASECHGTCEIPGYVEYALNRGAEVEVVFGGGEYVFIYRSLGEFAGLP